MRRSKDDTARRIHRLVRRLDKLFHEGPYDRDRDAKIDKTMAAIKIESENLSKFAKVLKKPKEKQRAVKA